MSTPLKVLICWASIAIALVVVVFYRYDLIDGIKRTWTQTNTDVAVVAQTENKTDIVSNEPKVTATEIVNNEPKVTATDVSTISVGQLEKGKKIYEEKCVLCHAASGKADTPVGQAMKATNLTLNKFTANNKNLESTKYILQVIENGVTGTAMVSFKSQIPNEQDRKDLAQYVHSLSGKK